MPTDQNLAKLSQQLMVENQLRPNRVSDGRLVEAFSAIPRHDFATAASRTKASESLAYADCSIALGDGRWLLEPRVLGRLLQAAEIGTNDAVLDLCCATGYTTALAAYLAALAVGVDSIPAQIETAEENLHNLSLSSGLVVAGDPCGGAANYAPYDVILVCGAVDFIPRTILEQLAEGGRLVTILRDPSQQIEPSPTHANQSQSGWGVLYRRFGAQFPHRKLFDANAPLLAEFAKTPEFVF